LKKRKSKMISLLKLNKTLRNSKSKLINSMVSFTLLMVLKSSQVAHPSQGPTIWFNRNLRARMMTIMTTHLFQKKKKKQK